MTNSPIESFIKKYRTCISNKNKDIRISIDEATDIIAAFAKINTSNEDLSLLIKSIRSDLSEIKQSINSENSGFDGGHF